MNNANNAMGIFYILTALALIIILLIAIYNKKK